jgi:hypothetical protein
MFFMVFLQSKAEVGISRVELATWSAREAKKETARLTFSNPKTMDCTLSSVQNLVLFVYLDTRGLAFTWQRGTRYVVQ